MKCIKCKEREQVAAAYAKGLCHACLVKQAQDHLAGLKAPSIPSGFMECPKCGGVGLHAPTCGGGFVDSEAVTFTAPLAWMPLQPINPAMFGPPMVGKYPSWWAPDLSDYAANGWPEPSYRGEAIGHPPTLARFAKDFAFDVEVAAVQFVRPGGAK